MECYIDESGNTGCVVTNKKGLNYKDSPTFIIGMVITKDDADKEALLLKYKRIKEKYGITDEIKGSDLCTRKYNDVLMDVIDSVFDSDHFLLNIYDKKFYISTLLLKGILGQAFYEAKLADFYYHAAELSKQDDNFFIRYDQYISKMSVEAFHEYLVFLREYQYKDIEEDNNLIKLAAISMLERKDEAIFWDEFLHYGSYKSRNITNLINLNALSEAIFFCKEKYNIWNGELVWIHDHQQQFESVIKKELSSYNICISFADSKESELLQLADNLSSIIGHFYSKMLLHFKNKSEWHETSLWDMSILSKVVRKISAHSIKYTVPLYDWAAMLCIVEMYKEDYPPKYRSNLFFNFKYENYQRLIYMDLENNKKDMSYVIKKLKE